MRKAWSRQYLLQLGKVDLLDAEEALVDMITEARDLRKNATQ